MDLGSLFNDVKTCIDCGVTKSTADFYRSISGFQMRCKKCASKVSAARRLERLAGAIGTCSLGYCDRARMAVKSDYCESHQRRKDSGMPDWDGPIRPKRAKLLNISDPGHKECTRCSRCLPIESFQKNRSTADGLQSYCRECSRAGFRKYAYKIDEAQFMALLEAQCGVCKSCGEPPADGETLHVDHDHDCCPESRTCGNCVRGLLHRECNQLEGRVRRNPFRYLSALVYYMGLRPAQSAMSREDELIQRLVAEVQLWQMEQMSGVRQ